MNSAQISPAVKKGNGGQQASNGEKKFDDIWLGKASDTNMHSPRSNRGIREFTPLGFGPKKQETSI